MRQKRRSRHLSTIWWDSTVKHLPGQHTAPLPRTCDNFLYVLNGTPSAPRAVRPWAGSEHGRRVHPGRALDRRGVPAAGDWGWRGSLAAGGGGPGPLLSVGTHGAGRRRSAVPPHPPPGSSRRHAPRLTALAEPSGRPPAPGMLLPRKLPVKGAAACGLRVPPLRSGQTPDSELPRQDQALAGRTGEDAEYPASGSRARAALRHRCRAGSAHCATSWPGLSRHSRPAGA